MKQLFYLFPLCAALAGCMTAAQHAQQLSSAHDRALTLGIVQTSVKPGVSAADVAAALGSPNIVTGDNQQHETWIYDKIATEASVSQDAGSIAAQLAGNEQLINTGFGTTTPDHGPLSGHIAGAYSKSAAAASITQRTLTVIIKFKNDHTVESVAYNSTRF
jgi:outer membrane protein assembly factor BamE (lipoprotein component of BamABCDE complex)